MKPIALRPPEGYGDVLSYGIITKNATAESISSMSERALRLVTTDAPRQLGWLFENTQEGCQVTLRACGVRPKGQRFRAEEHSTAKVYRL